MCPKRKVEIDDKGRHRSCCRRSHPELLEQIYWLRASVQHPGYRVIVIDVVAKRPRKPDFTLMTDRPSMPQPAMLPMDRAISRPYVSNVDIRDARGSPTLRVQPRRFARLTGAALGSWFKPSCQQASRANQGRACHRSLQGPRPSDENHLRRRVSKRSVAGETVDVLKAIKRNRLFFPMACVGVFALISISEGSYWQSTRTLDRLGEMAIVPTSLQELQWGVLDAEAALKTGASVVGAESREAQLAAHGQAMQTIAGAFTALDTYYADQAPPKILLTGLHRTTAAKLAGQGPGVEQMDAIRALSAQLLQYEARHVVADRGSLYDTLMMGRVGVASLSVIGLLTLFIALRQRAALESQRSEQQRLVQAAHDLLELEVLQRTTELTKLTHHLQTAREDERARLARDLHDEMGALMTSAKLDAARIRFRLGALPTPAPEALERLTHLISTLNQGIALKRRIVEDLQPSSLTVLGLVATLEIMAREFGASSGLKVQCQLEPVQLSARASLMIYRLVQEALTNIGKYAQASQVWLVLGSQRGQVEVSIRDDGVGFDMHQPLRSAHGLVGMRFRVEAEGGAMNIAAAPGSGTLVSAKLNEQPQVAVDAPDAEA